MRQLRKFPLEQNLFNLTNNDDNITDIGILKNGVELRSPISEDVINYGGLTEIDVINGGSNYDVLVPPTLEVSSPSSGGTRALVQPVVVGEVTDIQIDPQDFDIQKVLSVTVEGGNGSGAVFEPILSKRKREISFDGRLISQYSKTQCRLRSSK